MYKLLLCWRYLRTRYIALVCIISVTLGVATMIVVNSVMAGFMSRMDGMMTDMLGDIVLKVNSMDGVADAEAHMAVIRKAAGDAVACMSPSAAAPALIYMQLGNTAFTRSVTLVGIDEKTYGSVSNLGAYLQHPANRQRLEFLLRESGYDAINENLDPDAPQPGKALKAAGWSYRRQRELERRAYERRIEELTAASRGGASSGGNSVKNPFAQAEAERTQDPFASSQPADEGRDFDPMTEQHPGIVLAISECNYTGEDGSMQFLNRPGDDIRVSFPKATLPPGAINAFYTIVDLYTVPVPVEGMSMAFVPLEQLQRSRGMIDPTTGIGKFNSIQIKLKAGVDAEEVSQRIRRAFDLPMYSVMTWKDTQAPLLHAIRTEITLLNILLFMIVAVAGFGILAIFFMIVVEKTRDIGILKSLGASKGGIMSIFLAYGFSLGLVGAGVGTGIGILFATHINEIKRFVESMSGQPLFDSSIYFFYKIPTIIEPLTVAAIVAGAVLIAVLASVLPARRAARLHPVRALRYE
jgi:lipoprotein-releasing system permease protein